MYINNINPYQGMQNAIRPGGSNTSGVDNRPVSSSVRTSAAAVPESETDAAQMLGITERIDSLQREMDLNQVHFPPFFPIATYQRMDIIGKIRNIQEDIGRSSLGPDVKQAIAAPKLADEASDTQVADVLDKMFALRDTLSQKLAAVKKNIQPGSILKLEA